MTCICNLLHPRPTSNSITEGNSHSRLRCWTSSRNLSDYWRQRMRGIVQQNNTFCVIAPFSVSSIDDYCPWFTTAHTLQRSKTFPLRGTCCSLRNKANTLTLLQASRGSSTGDERLNVKIIWYLLMSCHLVQTAEPKLHCSKCHWGCWTVNACLLLL